MKQVLLYALQHKLAFMMALLVFNSSINIPDFMHPDFRHHEDPGTFCELILDYTQDKWVSPFHEDDRGIPEGFEEIVKENYLPTEQITIRIIAVQINEFPTEHTSLFTQFVGPTPNPPPEKGYNQFTV